MLSLSEVGWIKGEQRYDELKIDGRKMVISVMKYTIEHNIVFIIYRDENNNFVREVNFVKSKSKIPDHFFVEPRFVLLNQTSLF